jgi:competence protein ComGC
MKKGSFLLFLFVVLLVLPSLSFAKLNVEISCNLDDECVDACDIFFPGLDCYCKLNGFCADRETSVTTNTTTTSTASQPAATTVDITQLKSKVDSLENKLADLNLRVRDLEGGLSTLKLKVNKLGTTKKEISSLEKDLNKVSTGQAGLQEDIGSVKTGLISVEESLGKEQSFTSLTKVILVLIIIVMVLMVIAYFTTRKNRPEGRKAGHHPVMDYITTHIKQGAKFPQIKQNLLKAGWKENHINSAYQATMKRNYHNYVRGKSQSSLSPQKKKMIAIAVISLVFILATYFFLQASTGQAIQVQESFSHGEIFECTSPHIVAPNGGCCLDENVNEICDNLEEYDSNRANEDAEVCNDHNDCSSGNSCIDNSCQVLTTLYHTDCEDDVDKCNIREIEIITSDGDSFNMHGNQGSYTAAGALEWIIKPIPNYCKNGAVRVPIEVISKGAVCRDEAGSEITCLGGMKSKIELLQKQIITLGIGEASEPITHPNKAINRTLNGFTLSVEDANEFCFPG